MVRTLRRARVIVAGLALVTFCGSLLIGSWLFPHLSSNNDEPVYVLEAKQLEAGHLSLSASAHGDAFRPWMSGRTGGDRLVLVVQPVLPAILAASDTLFGTMRVGLGLVAAGAVLAVFVATRELLRDERIALTAAALFVASPFVLVQSALYLSYVLAVLLACVAIALVQRFMASGRRGVLVAAGTVVAVLFFARPIEGLMLAACIVAWMVSNGTGPRALADRLVVAGLGATPVLGMCLGYNWATTGNPVRFPLWVIGGNDAFGFGSREIVDGAPSLHFGPSEAWLATRTNLRAFPHWVVGGLFVLPLLVWGAVCVWRASRTVFALLAAIGVVFPVGYFFYYGNYLIIGGRNRFGPHYYLALLIPASIFAAAALVDLITRRAAVAALAVVLLVFGTALEVRSKIDENVTVRDRIARDVAAVSRVDQPSIVIVPAGVDGPFVLHPDGEFSNSPDLSDRKLYAADLQARNVELFDRFPDRAIYQLQTVDDGFGGHPEVRELYRLHEDSFDVGMNVTAPSRGPVVTADVGVEGSGASCRLAVTGDASGTVHVNVHLDAHAAVLSGCVSGTVAVALPRGPTEVAVRVSTASDGRPSERAELHYWARAGDDGVDLVVPAETWHAVGAGPATIVDPQSVGWLRVTSL